MCRPELEVEDKLRLGFLFLTLFLSIMFFLNYIDAAPTGIFNNPSVRYQISHANPEGGFDYAFDVSTNRQIEAGGLQIPPDETLTSWPNIGMVAIHSIVPTVVIFGITVCPSIGRYVKILISVVVSGLMYIGFVYYSGAGFDSPARVGGPIIELILISLVLVVYTKNPNPIAVSNTSGDTVQMYLDNQWRRIRILLFVAATISFGGVVTFATTTVARPVVISIFAGVFLTPIAGSAIFYYIRIYNIESNLGIV